MKKERGLSTEKPSGSGGPFIQPLALAGVCLVFVALLLSMAAMDFRTLDKTLVEYTEKRGIDFISDVQQATVFSLQRMDLSQQWDLGGAPSTGLEDQTLSLQESLVMAILRLAQRIDHETANGTLSHGELNSFISRQGLWNLALFDNRGAVVFHRRTVSSGIQKAIAGMVSAHADLKIRIFEPLNGPISSKFLALRRKDKEGFVVLAFDHRAFHLLKLRVATEMAVDAVGLPSNADCFFVGNGEGLALFQSGTCPELFSRGSSVSGFPEKHEGGGRARWNGRKQLLIMEEFLPGEGGALVARLGLNTESIDRMIVKEKRWGIIAMGFMVFMAVLSMWFLYRNQNRHIARVRQMERRLQQAERLSAMGRLASGVAHEIRNPLNAISMACQRLKEDNLEQLSTVIRNEIVRLNVIVEEFLGLSRGRQLKLEQTDLSDLVRQVGLLMGEESRHRGVEIQTDVTESGFVMSMDGNKIRQALINIVKNAMESIAGSGTVTIKLRLKEKRTAVISISDTGAGLGEDDVDKIFNLDFTTKEKGLGLGLALAHEIIQAHGGEIRVRSAEGVGTTFLLLLPVGGNLS